MVEAEKTLGAVQFVPSELSLERLKLRKHGIPVNLYGQVIWVLPAFTANPCGLVSRRAGLRGVSTKLGGGSYDSLGWLPIA